MLAGAAARDGDESWQLDEVTLLAPIPAPGAIYAIGLNYAKHVAETGATAPETPIVFVKVRGSVAPPGGPIHCPAVVKRLDYEGELVIVIGAGGAIGGYCVADDVTARDLQGREPQWTRAKGADTFCPFGPWVTTADEIPDAGNLRLQTWVNGDLRQDSSTSDLIFGCEQLVEFIAQTCTLMAGRPDPDRDPERRWDGDGPAAVPAVRRSGADRDRGTRGDRAPRRLAIRASR